MKTLATLAITSLMMFSPQLFAQTAETATDGKHWDLTDRPEVNRRMVEVNRLLGIYPAKRILRSADIPIDPADGEVVEALQSKYGWEIKLHIETTCGDKLTLHCLGESLVNLNYWRTIGRVEADE